MRWGQRTPHLADAAGPDAASWLSATLVTGRARHAVSLTTPPAPCLDTCDKHVLQKRVLPRPPLSAVETGDMQVFKTFPWAPPGPRKPTSQTPRSPPGREPAAPAAGLWSLPPPAHPERLGASASVLLTSHTDDFLLARV